MPFREGTKLKPDGYSILVDPDGPTVECDLLQCVHCGSQFPIPRSGDPHVRGFCWKCSGPVCGELCAECVPNEIQLENLEAGMASRTPSTKVHSFVQKLWTPGG